MFNKNNNNINNHKTGLARRKPKLQRRINGSNIPNDPTASRSESITSVAEPRLQIQVKMGKMQSNDQYTHIEAKANTSIHVVSLYHDTVITHDFSTNQL